MPTPGPTAKQSRLIWLALTGLALATIVALIAALIWGLGRLLDVLSPVLWPIAVAGVVACLLDPVVTWLERKQVPRTRAIVLVFVLALVIVAGVIGSLVPQVVAEARQLASKVPDYASRVQQRIDYWASHPPRFVRQYLESHTTNAPPAEPSTNAPSLSAVSTNAPPADAGASNTSLLASINKDTLQKATTWLSNALPAAGKWLFGRVSVVASIFGLLAGCVLVPVYVFYFLLEKRGITANWQDYLPVRDSKFKDELAFVLQSVNDYIIAFFRGQVLVAMCDSILYTIGFVIIGLPYALLIGVMALFLVIIPFIGSITVCLTALIISVVTFGDWQHPLYVLIVFAIVQALEGTVISPKIMGDRVGLPPLAIIIALMFGTTLLGGILGGILAIPLAAALRVIMFRYVWKKRAE